MFYHPYNGSYVDVTHPAEIFGKIDSFHLGCSRKTKKRKLSKSKSKKKSLCTFCHFCGKEVSFKKQNSRNPLGCVIENVISYQKFFKKNNIEVSGSLYSQGIIRFKKQQVKDAVVEFFGNQNKSKDVDLFIICYSGHGTKNDGDWVFDDGMFGCTEIIQLWIEVNLFVGHYDKNLMIISDCCHSGAWVKRIKSCVFDSLNRTSFGMLLKPPYYCRKETILSRINDYSIENVSQASSCENSETMDEE